MQDRVKFSSCRRSGDTTNYTKIANQSANITDCIFNDKVFFPAANVTAPFSSTRNPALPFIYPQVYRGPAHPRGAPHNGHFNPNLPFPQGAPFHQNAHYPPNPPFPHNAPPGSHANPGFPAHAPFPAYGPHPGNAPFFGNAPFHNDAHPGNMPASENGTTDRHTATPGPQASEHEGTPAAESNRGNTRRAGTNANDTDTRASETSEHEGTPASQSSSGSVWANLEPFDWLNHAERTGFKEIIVRNYGVELDDSFEHVAKFLRDRPTARAAVTSISLEGHPKQRTILSVETLANLICSPSLPNLKSITISHVALQGSHVGQAPPTMFFRNNVFRTLTFRHLKDMKTTDILETLSLFGTKVHTLTLAHLGKVTHTRKGPTGRFWDDEDVAVMRLPANLTVKGLNIADVGYACFYLNILRHAGSVKELEHLDVRCQTLDDVTVLEKVIRLSSPTLDKLDIGLSELYSFGCISASDVEAVIRAMRVLSECTRLMEFAVYLPLLLEQYNAESNASAWVCALQMLVRLPKDLLSEIIIHFAANHKECRIKDALKKLPWGELDAVARRFSMKDMEYTDLTIAVDGRFDEGELCFISDKLGYVTMNGGLTITSFGALDKFSGNMEDDKRHTRSTIKVEESEPQLNMETDP